MMSALALGLLPDRAGAIADGRVTLCETVTLTCSLAIARGDRETIETILDSVTLRNAELLSMALRREDGSVHTSVGDHENHWGEEASQSNLTQMHVPVQLGGRPWGQLELRFKPLGDSHLTFISTSSLIMILFVVALSFIGQYNYLRRVLRHLDPSKVIPDRVRETLDSLAEGLLVIDKDERIVLANESFSQALGQRPEELQGHKASELPWLGEDDSPAPSPWSKSIREGLVETGHIVKLGENAAVQRTLQVNSAPIRGANGEFRGALATFSDVTALEVRNSQLGETLSKLKESRDQVSEQNEQLRTLAMVDPLTQCLNRRAFLEELESQIAQAQLRNEPICYVIMDLDHFKCVNDNHGHKVGDDVLQQASQIIRCTVGELGVVCRYGGEEFSLLLPQLGLELAGEVAEAIRRQIETTPIADLKVTASFGLVEIDVNAAEPLEALEQADQALYYSKRTGRNRVTRWDEVPRDADFPNVSRDSEAPSAAEELKAEPPRSRKSGDSSVDLDTSYQA